MFLRLGEIYRGWLLAEDGRGEEGLAEIRRGLTAYHDVGAEMGRPTFLGIFAEICDELRRPEEALSAIAEALDSGERTGLHYWDAELHRLKGTLILRAEASSASPARRPRRGGAERDAESCFLEAIAIARRQQAKSLELRAAMSLSRLWHRQGETRKAHALLSEVYGWFTGFRHERPVDARALLDQLDG